LCIYACVFLLLNSSLIVSVWCICVYVCVCTRMGPRERERRRDSKRDRAFACVFICYMYVSADNAHVCMNEERETNKCALPRARVCESVCVYIYTASLLPALLIRVQENRYSVRLLIAWSHFWDQRRDVPQCTCIVPI